MPEDKQYILVYSNKYACRRYYAANLLARGYVAVEASTFSECEEVILTALPSLVLICGLPYLSETVVREVRECAELGEVPIVTISTISENTEWRERWGIVAHFEHPAAFQDLLTLLAPYIGDNRGSEPGL